MSGAWRRWLPGLAAVAVVVGLPLAGHWLRRADPTGCALDGAAIPAAYRVEVVDGQGRTHAFCCVRCAQLWLESAPESPRAITVTDEAGGGPLDATTAHYVRSWVLTMPATGNRIHVFATRRQAQEHAAAFAGTVLAGSEGPFHRWLRHSPPDSALSQKGEDR
jgi:hypothetical protein